MSREKIRAAITEKSMLLETFLLSQEELLNSLADFLVATFHRGGRFFLVGSGPFGAISSLIGQTFLHRQTLERPALPAFCLANDTGLATFLAGEELTSQLFSRQLRALANDQDVLLVLAGNHLYPAEREAITMAKQIGCHVILIAGEQVDGAGSHSDSFVPIPSDSLPRLQETSLFIGNLLCTLIEEKLFGF